MKTPVTIDSLLTRIKKEVQQKEKVSAQKKLEAKEERKRRQEQPSIYLREDLWFGVAIHREYEVQLCDCCKTEITVFNCDKVELRHKIDRSAIRWLKERGEGMDNLPMQVHILERVIPECFACLTAGKLVQHLFNRKGIHHDQQQKEGSQVPRQDGGAQEEVRSQDGEGSEAPSGEGGNPPTPQQGHQRLAPAAGLPQPGAAGDGHPLH